MTTSERTVCVYCGSRAGREPAYLEAARELGHALGRGGWRLVYGAGDLGLMGETARAAQAAGAKVIGFIPGHLMALEAGRRELDAIIVTETMHERKKLMFTNADAVIALPGGPGTLDELVEVLTWRQLGLHAKPVFVLNVGGYWDPLIRLFEHMIAEGFMDASFRDYFTVAPSVTALMEALEASVAAPPAARRAGARSA